jgi:hypothetical protein
MHQAILILIGGSSLILGGWAIVRCSAPVRVCVCLGLIILFSFVAYGLGRSVERFRCTSTHMYALRHYSGALKVLASEGRDDDLRNAVLRVDEVFQAGPYSWLRLQDAITDVRILVEGAPDQD